MHQTPHIRFLRPGRFDDIVEVAVVCSHVGTSSFTLSMRLACENTILAEIKNVYVNVDAAPCIPRSGRRRSLRCRGSGRRTPSAVRRARRRSRTPDSVSGRDRVSPS
ncbi:hotdog domain-containing protein [Leucobacter sp. NPDC077196]|uniref:acyl-CoA thioesterase n=1 Tax=Leucobacter sp. NPDC077196 TaxID=3154959 RepID=UPI00343B4DB0